MSGCCTSGAQRGSGTGQPTVSKALSVCHFHLLSLGEVELIIGRVHRCLCASVALVAPSCGQGPGSRRAFCHVGGFDLLLRYNCPRSQAVRRCIVRNGLNGVYIIGMSFVLHMVLKALSSASEGVSWSIESRGFARVGSKSKPLDAFLRSHFVTISPVKAELLFSRWMQCYVRARKIEHQIQFIRCALNWFLKRVLYTVLKQ